jgi:hypothetical protein
MTPGTLVLLHSPLTTASVWAPLRGALGAYDVVVPEVTDDDRPPYAGRYVARAALEIAAAGVTPPLVLVGHGAAGPLLPQIGAAQRAAHRLVGAYVFLDATLPGPYGTTQREEKDVTAPTSVTLRNRPPEFFAEELPVPQDWPDAPCGYLLVSLRHATEARTATMRGWQVGEHPSGHFATVTDPEGTAGALTALISAL